MKQFDRLIQLCQGHRVYIQTHNFPDPDAIGSAFGLQRLLGVYGIHSFYLGNTSRGLMQLLISLLTCGFGAIAMFIWGVLEGIKLLDGRINIDANGVFLKD